MIARETLNDRGQEQRIFDGSLEKLGEVEAGIVSRLLLHPGQRLSGRDIIGAVMSGEEEPSGFEEGYKKIEATVGWPSDEDEEITYDVLSPLEIRQIIEKGTSSMKFNNWFTKFVYAPGKVPGDACSRILPDGLTQVCPTKYRLRTVCPTLVKTLEDYGASHTKMNEFYNGLLEDQPMLGLFAVADQLAQRLVRPDDAAYEGACIDLIVAAKGESFTPPVYDLLQNSGEVPKTQNARAHLFR